MPLNRVLLSMSQNMDSVLGANGLKPALKARLLGEQIKAIIQVTPPMSAGAVALSLMIVAVSSRTSMFWPMVAWCVALHVALLGGLRAWWRGRHRAGSRGASQRGIRRAALNAFIMGSLWGVVPALLIPMEDIPVKLAAALVTAGVLCASAFALSVLPLAAICFTMPVLAGSALAVAQMDSAAEAAPVGYLLMAFVCVMPFVVARLSSGFIERIVSESRIREQKDIISLLLKEFEDASSDWLWEFDRDGRMERVSDRFAAAFGASAEALTGRDFCDFLRSMHPENGPLVAEIATDIAAREMFQDVEIRLAGEGEERVWRLTGKPAFDAVGDYSGYLGTASDITASKLAERRINFLAHNDPLTGLLNRTKFTEHLKHAVARLERYGSPFALMFLDLDQFKSINDSRGHLAGDKLLAEVARRIRSTIRETDLAARLGGDEFAVLLANSCDSKEVSSLAARLVETVGKPYEIDDEIVSVGVSIGIALAPINGTRPDQILRNADLALYRAKAEGKNTWRLFETQMDSDLRERRMLELELRQALKDGELVLYYQPLVSADDNKPSGFEALMRWNHPIRGVVPPSEFIPIAEQCGLIMQIGDWTIREACKAAALWPDDLLVAVNLSAKHFQMSDIVAVVREALAESGLPPHRLELEITESLLIEDPEEVIGKLAQVKELGVTVAMDDFGTGYSSLSYLLKFPFDKIKIDKSFVTASSRDAVARDILRSIASLGKTLKIRITAEGVETQEQVEFLRDISCHQLQGFYFARPLNQADLAAYFLSNFAEQIAPLAKTGGKMAKVA